MAQEQGYPISVMFDVFKSFGGVSNRDVAYIILSDKPLAGGRSPRDRIGSDKTFLSRSVVHSMPGELPEAMFANFENSAYHLLSQMHDQTGSQRTPEDVCACFSGWAAHAMSVSLRTYALDDTVYLNTVRGLSALEEVSAVKRAYLLVLLFLVTGCTQDPRRGAEYTLEVASDKYSAHLYTQATQTFPSVEGEAAEEAAEDLRLALFRVVGNRLRGGPYRLSTDGEGTDIGYLSTSASSITDVEETVSRRHLNIYRAEDGQWYARGLGSRNGTVLISGEDRSETVIEPPRDKAEGFISRDVRIGPGDRLLLARDTEFMVVQVES